MEIKELREKEKNELVKLLKEARAELVKLRLERKIGSLVDGSAVGKKRKEVVRILTVLREKEILEEAATTEARKGKGSTEKGKKLATKEDAEKGKGTEE